MGENMKHLESIVGDPTAALIICGLDLFLRWFLYGFYHGKFISIFHFSPPIWGEKTYVL